MAQSLNWFHQIKAARRVCTEGFPRCPHCLFSVGLFSPLPRSHWEQGSISLSRSCSQRPKENKQYRTWCIKRREERNILGKYQSTYFMIFKCHFCSNIDLFFFYGGWIIDPPALGDQSSLSSTQLVNFRIEVLVISYEFHSPEDQTAEKILRGDPSREDNTPGKEPEWAAEKRETTSQSCCLQTDVAAGILSQEQNSIHSFICLTRLLSPRTGFWGKLFQGCTGW